jgi:hypothetical protein
MTGRGMSHIVILKRITDAPHGVVDRREGCAAAQDTARTSDVRGKSSAAGRLYRGLPLRANLPVQGLG